MKLFPKFVVLLVLIQVQSQLLAAAPRAIFINADEMTGEQLLQAITNGCPLVGTERATLYVSPAEVELGKDLDLSTIKHGEAYAGDFAVFARANINLSREFSMTAAMQVIYTRLMEFSKGVTSLGNLNSPWNKEALAVIESQFREGLTHEMVVKLCDLAFSGEKRAVCAQNFLRALLSFHTSAQRSFGKNKFLKIFFRGKVGSQAQAELTQERQAFFKAIDTIASEFPGRRLLKSGEAPAVDILMAELMIVRGCVNVDSLFSRMLFLDIFDVLKDLQCDFSGEKVLIGWEFERLDPSDFSGYYASGLRRLYHDLSAQSEAANMSDIRTADVCLRYARHMLQFPDCCGLGGEIFDVSLRRERYIVGLLQKVLEVEALRADAEELHRAAIERGDLTLHLDGVTIEAAKGVDVVSKEVPVTSEASAAAPDEQELEDEEVAALPLGDGDRFETEQFTVTGLSPLSDAYKRITARVLEDLASGRPPRDRVKTGRSLPQSSLVIPKGVKIYEAAISNVGKAFRLYYYRDAAGRLIAWVGRHLR